MTLAIDQLRKTRENIIKIIDGHSLDDLNKTPEGYNNNLIWNAGHVLVTQQRLVYSLSKLATNIDPELMNKYGRGTKPNTVVSQEEVDLIKKMLLDNVSQTLEDINSGSFTEFNEYETSYGLTLKNVEDAIAFNNLHEAMHLGYMMAMKKKL